MGGGVGLAAYQFAAEYRHLARGIHAKTDGSAADVEDADNGVEGGEGNLFIQATGEHEHGGSPYQKQRGER